MTVIKNRIKELRMIPANKIRENEKNIRSHPVRQVEVMTELLEGIGFAGAMIGREDEEGNVVLIDGHLRKEISGKDEVPILIVDLSEDEAATVMAAYDQVTGLGTVDGGSLQDLLEGVDLDGELKDFLDSISETDVEDVLEVENRKLREEHDHKVKGMDLFPNESYDYILIQTDQERKGVERCSRAVRD